MMHKRDPYAMPFMHVTVVATIALMTALSLAAPKAWSQELTATERRLEELRRDIAEEERLLEEAAEAEEQNSSALTISGSDSWYSNGTPCNRPSDP
jgi:septal ring factor EnvC (AmiA/AmiB activator)